MQSQRNTDTDKTREPQELVDIFNKVEVSIPLLEVIKNVAKYTKFLKDICIHKRKLKGNELVNIEKNVSAFIQLMSQ